MDPRIGEATDRPRHLATRPAAATTNDALAEPATVDQRRAQVGLSPLGEHLATFESGAHARVSDPRLLVLTGGHPFVLDAFTEAFDAIAPKHWTHATQPTAQDFLTPSAVEDFDALVFYDMPGITFTRADPPTQFAAPPASLIEGMRALLQSGVGMVFLHHSVASWPMWEDFAEIVGGRFHYQPGTLRGKHYPDSGYRFDVNHTVEVLDPTHPVCAGLGHSFALTDELYLYPVFEDDVVPLLRTTFPMNDPSQFFSTDAAIRGRRNTNDGWTHPTGSQLVGWAKNAGNSPVVYLQFGDGPTTYADPSFRRVVNNAVRWVASDEAHSWARARHDSAPRRT